jgi:hypothetical protein
VSPEKREIKEFKEYPELPDRVDLMDPLDPADSPDPPDPRVMWDRLVTQHRSPGILHLTVSRSELGISEIRPEDPSSFKRTERIIRSRSHLQEELRLRGTWTTMKETSMIVISRPLAESRARHGAQDGS